MSAGGAPFIGANTELTLAAGALFGATAGVVGTFALARRRSLLADVAAHASLPGVCLAFLAGEALGLGGRNPLLLLVGATLTALLATWSVPRLARLRGVGSDGAIAVSLSFFFGLGAVLLSDIQTHDSGAQGGIDHLLFGNAAATTRADLATMATIAIVCAVLVALFFKELAALCFDEQHAAVLGIAVRPLDLLLLGLLVATVVAGMQMAGIVLVVAMIIAPAAAARAVRGSLTRVTVVAGTIGASAAAAGVLLSRSMDSMPTGSAMTLVAATVFIASLLATPRRHGAAA
ncbi:MAG: zinc transport system rane protein TroC [Planctomycetota bacterium]|jgi:manganese/zinc/iron transport system permease protein